MSSDAFLPRTTQSTHNFDWRAMKQFLQTFSTARADPSKAMLVERDWVCHFDSVAVKPVPRDAVPEMTRNAYGAEDVYMLFDAYSRLAKGLPPVGPEESPEFVDFHGIKIRYAQQGLPESDSECSEESLEVEMLRRSSESLSMGLGETDLTQNSQFEASPAIAARGSEIMLSPLIARKGVRLSQDVRQVGPEDVTQTLELEATAELDQEMTDASPTVTWASAPARKSILKVRPDQEVDIAVRLSSRDYGRTLQLQNGDEADSIGMDCSSRGNDHGIVIEEAEHVDRIGIEEEHGEKDVGLVFGYASTASYASRRASSIADLPTPRSRRVSVNVGLQPNVALEDVRADVASFQAARRSSCVNKERRLSVAAQTPTAGLGGIPLGGSGVFECKVGDRIFELVVEDDSVDEEGARGVQCSAADIDGSMDVLFRREEEFPMQAKKIKVDASMQWRGEDEDAGKEDSSDEVDTENVSKQINGAQDSLTCGEDGQNDGNIPSDHAKGVNVVAQNLEENSNAKLYQINESSGTRKSRHSVRYASARLCLAAQCSADREDSGTPISACRLRRSIARLSLASRFDDIAPISNALPGGRSLFYAGARLSFDSDDDVPPLPPQLSLAGRSRASSIAHGSVRSFHSVAPAPSSPPRQVTGNTSKKSMGMRPQSHKSNVQTSSRKLASETDSDVESADILRQQPQPVQEEDSLFAPRLSVRIEKRTRSMVHSSVAGIAVELNEVKEQETAEGTVVIPRHSQRISFREASDQGRPLHDESPDTTEEQPETQLSTPVADDANSGIMGHQLLGDAPMSEDDDGEPYEVPDFEDDDGQDDNIQADDDEQGENTEPIDHEQGENIEPVDHEQGKSIEPDDDDNAPPCPEAAHRQCRLMSPAPVPLSSVIRTSGVNISPQQTPSESSKKVSKRKPRKAARKKAAHPTTGSKRKALPSRELTRLGLTTIHDSHAEDAEDDEGLDGIRPRRSKRVRIPPLEYWKGEQKRYERRRSQMLPTIKEVFVMAESEDEEDESWSNGKRGGRRRR